MYDTGNHTLSSALLGDHILNGPYDLDVKCVCFMIIQVHI